MKNNYYTSGCIISWIGEGYCPNCHKPYIYVGDVPPGGWTKGQEPYCTCGIKKSNVAQGWQCPVCGQVNAPWVAVCNGWHGQTTVTSTSTYSFYEDGTPVTDK